MFQSIIVLDIGMILNVYTFGYRDDTKCFDDIHVGNVITRQQRGGVLDGISGQYMKVSDVHVRDVTAGWQGGNKWSYKDNSNKPSNLWKDHVHQ